MICFVNMHSVTWKKASKILMNPLHEMILKIGNSAWSLEAWNIALNVNNNFHFSYKFTDQFSQSIAKRNCSFYFPSGYF